MQGPRVLYDAIPWFLVLAAPVAFRIVGLNIVLFIPRGFLLRIRALGWLRTVVVVAATSLTIETLQAVLPLGRTANSDDVLLNTLGGVLGAAAGSPQLRWRRSRDPSSDALSQQPRREGPTAVTGDERPSV